MTNTPDEIKKGLECCSISYADCNNECPYKPDCDGSQILKDALALIRHLEAERDAIMQDMNKNCTSCKHSGMNNPDNPCYKFEEQCRDNSKWQWRGVQKEE